MSKEIPTYDLYVEWQEEPLLHGVHKAHINAMIADLKASGAKCTFVENKAAKSSKFSKHQKDRDKKRKDRK